MKFGRKLPTECHIIISRSILETILASVHCVGEKTSFGDLADIVSEIPRGNCARQYDSCAPLKCYTLEEIKQ
jgi:hypothetical protein